MHGVGESHAEITRGLARPRITRRNHARPRAAQNHTQKSRAAPRAWSRVGRFAGFQLAPSEGDVRLVHSVRGGSLLNVLQYSFVDRFHCLHIRAHFKASTLAARIATSSSLIIQLTGIPRRSAQASRARPELRGRPGLRKSRHRRFQSSQKSYSEEDKSRGAQRFNLKTIREDFAWT